jgi:hypothetical protein
MTPRPTFRPSSTGPRLPISVDPDGRVSNHTRPLPIPSPSPSNDTEGYTPILEIPPRVRRTPSTLESEQFWDRHRPEYTRSVSSENRHRDRQRQRQRQRIWEEDIPHPSRPRSGISSTSSANMMLPASAQHTPHHANMDGYFPSIGIRPRVDFQPFHPPPAQPTRPMTAANPTQHVMPISEAPRHSNGAKKQQSGRKRTACDRCKRQKSSVSTISPLHGPYPDRPVRRGFHRRSYNRDEKDQSPRNTMSAMCRTTSIRLYHHQCRSFLR